MTNPRQGHEQFEGWLSIPYLAADGHPVSIRFRCIQDHRCKDYGHGKYQTIHGDRTRIYNIPGLVAAKETVHICEGELECAALMSAGLGPAVSFPGASTWRSWHRRMFSGFDNVYIWADPDKEGRRFANEIKGDVPWAKVVQLTEDVNDTLLHQGEGALHEALEEVST